MPIVVPTGNENSSGAITQTADNIIKGALRLIGMLAEGEEPSAETLADGLTAMNQMIDSWSTESLSIFSTQDQVFNWPAGEVRQTLGPTGDFLGNRPIALQDSTYFRDAVNGLSFGIKIVNSQQYNAIALKTVQSVYPQVLFVNMNMNNIEMFLYPVPNREIEFHFISVIELTQPTSAGQYLFIPPGYLRAFRFNLACELAAEFGVEPSPTVQRIAMTSKRNIKSQNASDDLMSMPYSIMGHRQRFNIFAANY